jgi:hypothetical protein
MERTAYYVLCLNVSGLTAVRYWYVAIEKLLNLALCKEQSPSLLLGNGGVTLFLLRMC